MEKTNAGLAAHCEMALSQGWYYLWGTYGEIATQALLDANIKQYPDNASWRSYAAGAIGKTRFSDCYGLVKSYLWWADDNGNPKYNAAQDVNTSMAYVSASERGPLSTLPEMPGIVLWMNGHVGVYMGGGRFLECRGGGVGMAEGAVSKGVITKGSKFTNWFKDRNIVYLADDGAGPGAIEGNLSILESAGIVQSPDYWLNNYTKLEYVDQLIGNMAAYVAKQEKPR